MGEWHHVMTMNNGTLEDCVLAMNACMCVCAWLCLKFVVCIFVSVMRYVRRLCACDECVYVCVRFIVFEVCCVHICVYDDAHVYGGDMCVWSLMCTYLYVNNIGKSTLKHGMHAGVCKYVWSLLIMCNTVECVCITLTWSQQRMCILIQYAHIYMYM